MAEDAGLLTDLLRRRIAVEGPMTVAAFMAEALGHPRLGYYMTRDPFGTAGDFTTAPEISQMFGELIGLWCAHVWSRMGAPRRVVLVELGPGRGTLMQDALRAAALVPAFREAIEPHLVETSPMLRQRQQATLAALPFAGKGPTWHDHLATVPEGPTLAIANEFFDALPIRQFVRTPEGWAERLVDANPDGAGLRFVLDRRSLGGAAEAMLPESVRAAPEGSVAEICPAGEVIAAELADRLVRHDGAALLIDYGHARSAAGETLQAVRRHTFAPVLEKPGEADLTAHVDFEVLARAARQTGARVHGPITQGAFLANLGIRERAAILRRAASVAQAADIDAALRRLIEPEEMGTLFKVMALTDPRQEPPVGF
ncbi:MAG TPA: class I SAM-dependent methyltransferase [Azospirillaceae bacterium]|nr:class I SAM-dependent methyltransferase [Azospirillaceae bacterium]